MKINSLNSFLLSFLMIGLTVSFIGCSSNDDDVDTPDNNNGNNSENNNNNEDNNNYTKGSAYLSKVFEYSPAPGQFVNDLPIYEVGDTKESMRKKAELAIAGANPSMITLGGYGGYVVFGFDHTVQNKEGLCDFRVKGNAFYANSNPNENAGKGGSCEPGIIMVAYDANKNGIPDDDEWYEIAGSEYSKSTTIHNYTLTYQKPDANKVATPSDVNYWAADTTYIKWNDNKGDSGYKTKNTFHSQSYYPLWETNESITFTGTKLANNAIDESGTGNYWVLYALSWGYADNAPNNDNESAIDIDWAVDKNGNKVKLPGIDFVKVYTGVNQEAGWLGETSTEVAGAEDLHILGKVIETSSVVK